MRGACTASESIGPRSGLSCAAWKYRASWRSRLASEKVLIQQLQNVTMNDMKTATGALFALLITATFPMADDITVGEDEQGVYYVYNSNVQSTVVFDVTFSGIDNQGKIGRPQTYSKSLGPKRRLNIGDRRQVTRPAVSNEKIQD